MHPLSKRARRASVATLAQRSAQGVRRLGLESGGLLSRPSACMSAEQVAEALDGRLAELRSGKVEVHVKAIGSAPALRQPRFTIDGSKRFVDLVMFLKTSLKLESLHVYCNDAFEPLQDECIADLKRCFGMNGRLTLSYSPEVMSRCVWEQLDMAM